jgi:hypothetical protein
MATAKTVRAKNNNKAEPGETLDDQTVGLSEPTREEIERRAYELYLARGEVNGYGRLALRVLQLRLCRLM